MSRLVSLASDKTFDSSYCPIRLELGLKIVNKMKKLIKIILYL